MVAGCRGVSICSCVVSIRSIGLAMAHDSWRREIENVKSKTIVFPQQRKKREKKEILLLLYPREKKGVSFLCRGLRLLFYFFANEIICVMNWKPTFSLVYSLSLDLWHPAALPPRPCNCIVFPSAVRSNGE